MRCRCFILLALVAAWLGLAQPSWSQGTIAYYQPETPIPLWIPPDSFDIARQFPFSFNGGSTPDLTFAYSVVSIGVMYGQETRSLSLMYPWPNIGGVPQPLPAGFLIGPGSGNSQVQWFSETPGWFALAMFTDSGVGGQFPGQHAYMGVEFQRAGATHYGWILLQIGAYGPVGQIEAWAWETRPDTAIMAGAVPEPSTWALLGAGGLLFWWYGRRKNASSAESMGDFWLREPSQVVI